MERRSRYRIDLGEQSLFEVLILSEGRRAIPGKLVDVGAEGVAVSVPANGTAALPVGIQVDITFTGERFMKQLTTAAVLKHCRRNGGGNRYGFEFTDREGVDETLLAQALYMLFSRRGAPRVHPDPRNPMEVAIVGEPGGVETTGIVEDLSATGMAILVDSDGEVALAGIDQLWLTFRVPDEEDPLRLLGVVRYRALQGVCIRYGISFDAARSDDFARQQHRIRNYVLRRRQGHIAAAPDSARDSAPASSAKA